MIATLACVIALAVSAPAAAPTPTAAPAPDSASEAPQAPIDPATISDPVLRAEAYFQRQKYAEAAEAFADAYEQNPKIGFLYARAQAERLAGRCDVAVQFYDRFLASGPPAEAARDAMDNRARCTATDPPPVPPPKVTPAADDKPADGDRSRRKWARDPAGGVLVALGSVTVVIGASLIAFASTRDGTAVSAPNEDEYLTRKKAARIQHRVGIAAAAVGGAMLVAGVIRWAVLASRERKQRVRAGVAGDRRGASISVAVSF
ncbi:MAG TPA: hypothetical protein VFG69_18100 [Nannocystaceae bacterium]|nr:hypothetical protein [Nannocystaceae bacterium]